MTTADSRPPQTLTVADLTVRFTWCADRWVHEVVRADGACWRSIEGGAEGTGDPRWPVSPVLVELSRLGRTPGPAILGVGLAGRSHFSASVGPDSDHPDWLRFDIACRVNEPPVLLGSTYHGPRGVVRVEPAPVAAPPPMTVQWGYWFTPDGILPLPAARVEPPPD